VLFVSAVVVVALAAMVIIASLWEEEGAVR
jgi:hypothetical protein